jgi:hypothetical protein
MHVRRCVVVRGWCAQLNKPQRRAVQSAAGHLNKAAVLLPKLTNAGLAALRPALNTVQTAVASHPASTEAKPFALDTVPPAWKDLVQNV